MINNDTISIKLYADAQRFKAGLVGAERDVQRFSAVSQREMKAAERAGHSLASTLTSLGIGAAFTANVVMAARLDKSLIQIGQTAGMSAEEVAELRKELFRMGGDTGQGIDGLRDGFNNAVQSGLKFKEALPVMDAVNKAMAVTGASAGVLTSGLTVAATAFNFDLSKPGQALKMLDQMTVAGRLGNAELQSLSDIFARVGPGAATAGLGFEKTLAFIEGLSQIEKQPERLATLADSTLRLFTNSKYMENAAAATGVKFFNKDKSRRDPLEVLKDFKKQYDKLADDKARFKFMSEAFGKADLDTIKGLRTLFGTDMLNKISGQFSADIKNASGALEEDLQKALNNSVDQTGRLKNKLREAADGFVQPINETLANVIRWGLDKKENGGLGLDGKDMMLGGAGLAVGTLVAAKFGSKVVSSLAGKFGSIGAGVATGKALETAAGVTPVYVVNMPAGGIGGEIPAGTPAGISDAAKALPLAAVAIPVAVAAGVAVSAYQAYKGFQRLSAGMDRINADNDERRARRAVIEEKFRAFGGETLVKGTKNYDFQQLNQVLAGIEGAARGTQQAEVGAKLDITVTDSRVSVKSIKASDNMKINVDSGYTMSGA